jgi:ferredoxin-type protein NapH
MNRGLRTVFWLVFALACGGHRLHGVRGHLAHRHPLARADLRAGPGAAVGAALLLFEVVISRRAWCRYACPIGLTYGVVGIFSPVRVKYNTDGCFHEGDCRKVCLVPHVLDTVIKGRAVDPRCRSAPTAHAAACAWTPARPVR